ncbi:hypothetical protein LCGC14_2436440, partial [marine sediment metagenome]
MGKKKTIYKINFYLFPQKIILLNFSSKSLGVPKFNTLEASIPPIK